MADTDMVKQSNAGKRSIRVAEVVDDGAFVILNVGSDAGVKREECFMIYKKGDKPIVDPETGEQLEPLITIRGYGRVIHVQNKICTVQGTKTPNVFSMVPQLSAWMALRSLYPDPRNPQARDIVRFQGAEVGDYAIQVPA